MRCDTGPFKSPLLLSGAGAEQRDAAHRQSLLQFSSVMPSSSSPQMLTEEQISASSTAKQQRRAKTATHFCWLCRDKKNCEAPNSESLQLKFSVVLLSLEPSFESCVILRNSWMAVGEVKFANSS